MYISDNWTDYELIDCGNGEKYERWKDKYLLRPDPQAIWPMDNAADKIDARYNRSSKGGGEWEYFMPLPESWTISWNELVFNVRPSGFKHTGIFPEQSINWEWMQEKIKARTKKASASPKVLNLFAYTGGATLACLSAGAEVVHLDAAKGMVAWAKENAYISGLSDKPVRWIVDDALKFVKRELRRGNKYDAILMDPPSYGRGPGGEMWKIEDSLYELVDSSAAILSDNPLFFLINSYTTGLAPSVLSNVLNICISSKHGGHIESKELALPVSRRNIILPCGASGRWEQ